MTTIPETLTWHDAGVNLPDGDTTVLMWIVYSDNESDWCAGWRDGDVWRDASSAMPVSGLVTHWSEPSGPVVNVELSGPQR